MDKATIKSMLDTTLDRTVVFDDFSERVMNLGARQICLDLIRREHIVYGAENEQLTNPLPGDYQFSIAEHFDEETLRHAIAAFDSQQITPKKFMETMAKSGVMMATAFLAQRRCMYIGRQGQFFLEQW